MPKDMTFIEALCWLLRHPRGVCEYRSMVHNVVRVGDNVRMVRPQFHGRGYCGFVS